MAIGGVSLGVKMTEEECRRFVDEAFMLTIGKDFNYVVEAVKEKMLREGELSEKE